MSLPGQDHTHPALRSKPLLLGLVVLVLNHPFCLLPLPSAPLLAAVVPGLPRVASLVSVALLPGPNSPIKAFQSRDSPYQHFPPPFALPLIIPAIDLFSQLNLPYYPDQFSYP